MNIRFLGIDEEVLTDASFIGARLNSIGCGINCPGCFNQALKKKDVLYADAQLIIDMIKSNPLHKGIIFGGLEWSEQPEELIYMVNLAQKEGLNVIIYTGLSKETFLKLIPELSGSGVLLKAGHYIKDSKQIKSKGVKLTSVNQEVFEI